MRQALTDAAKRPLVALFVLAAIPCIALAQSAQDFANKVAISDMFEIQSSQLALTKQPDADTKPSGDNRDLKSWAATTLPHLKEHLSMSREAQIAP